MNRFIRRSNKLTSISFNQSLWSENHPPLEGGEGFGCPGKEYQCDGHCKANGFQYGNCDALFWRRCHCH